MAEVRKFGEIAIAEGFCTEEQVQIALDLINENKIDIRIGALLELGYLTEDQVKRILEIQEEERKQLEEE